MDQKRIVKPSELTVYICTTIEDPYKIRDIVETEKGIPQPSPNIHYTPKTWKIWLRPRRELTWPLIQTTCQYIYDQYVEPGESEKTYFRVLRRKVHRIGEYVLEEYYLPNIEYMSSEEIRLFIKHYVKSRLFTLLTTTIMRNPELYRTYRLETATAYAREYIGKIITLLQDELTRVYNIEITKEIGEVIEKAKKEFIEKTRKYVSEIRTKTKPIMKEEVKAIEEILDELSKLRERNIDEEKRVAAKIRGLLWTLYRM